MTSAGGRHRFATTEVSIAEVAARARPLTSSPDCTGGWRSAQRWDVVALPEVLPDLASRSVRVTSSTGDSRLSSRADGDRVYLCTGYAGRPLARGHGAPVRILAPATPAAHLRCPPRVRHPHEVLRVHRRVGTTRVRRTDGIRMTWLTVTATPAPGLLVSFRGEVRQRKR